MSTKWNNGQRLQKTPKVCKKPPLALPPTLETFFGYPLQAYASWSNPFSPTDASIAGMVVLKAFPLSKLHFGKIAGDPHSLEIDLLYDPDSTTFFLTLSLIKGETVVDQRFRQWQNDLPVVPFAAGLFTWNNDGTTVHADCKVLS